MIMILEQFLNKKAEEINNPISNWGVGYTAEVVNEWIKLQGLVKNCSIPDAVGQSEQLKAFLDYCDEGGWIKNIDKYRIIKEYTKSL
jgi:hypothetical protein